MRDFTNNLLVLLFSKFDLAAYLLGTLFIMIGGGYMLLSGFNEEYYNKGKTTITWAVIGMFVAQSASALVSFITLEANSVSGGGDLLVDVIQSLIGTIFDLMQIALFAVAIYSGMRMVISRGQEDEFKKAREGLFYAAIGAVIINLADSLVSAIRTL